MEPAARLCQGLGHLQRARRKPSFTVAKVTEGEAAPEPLRCGAQTGTRSAGRSEELRACPFHPSAEASFPRASPEGRGLVWNFMVATCKGENRVQIPRNAHSRGCARWHNRMCVNCSPSDIQNEVFWGKYLLLVSSLPKTEKPQGSW